MKKTTVLFVLFAVLGLASCTSKTDTVTEEVVVDSTGVAVDTTVVAIDSAAVDNTPAK